jgi:hypothetical protein
MPITVAARSKAWTVFAGTLGSCVRIPLKLLMSVLCAFILGLCCPVCRERPCDGLIPRPRRPADCVYDQEPEKSGQGQSLSSLILIPLLLNRIAWSSDSIIDFTSACVAFSWTLSSRVTQSLHFYRDVCSRSMFLLPSSRGVSGGNGITVVWNTSVTEVGMFPVQYWTYPFQQEGKRTFKIKW